MAERSITIDVVDMSVPIKNHRIIPVINEPNPVSGYTAVESQVRQLIQLSNLRIIDNATNKIVDGNTFYDFFPPSGGGGGGGGSGDISRYTVEKSTNGSTGEVSYDLIEQLNNGVAHKVGDVIGIRGSQMLVQYGSQLSILDTTLATIKEKIDATFNFTTFTELNITTSGKTLKEITDELYAKGLPTNTIVTGQLYSSALPFSGNGEAEVMINGPAFWWKCTSLNVAPYSWNAICGGGSWSGIIMDWTPTYQTEEPMVFKGSATLTADSSDTTKCSITVSTPSTASRIKRGYIYKVTSIAASPAYTGTIKVGDTLIADKDAPVIGPTWTVDTDWTVVPSGDEEGKIYYAAVGGGLQLSGADNNEFGHSNTPITAKTELGIVKVKYDALGHITESEDALTDTAVTGLVTAAPSEADPANKITYYSYANERLTLHKIGFTTDNRFVSTRTQPPVIVARQTDFVNNTHSVVPTAADLAASLVYSEINRCNVADDGTINAYYGDAGYTEDGSNGQVMVYIPKFYYKMTPITLDGVNIREGRWEVSNVQIDNTWTVHPAFIGPDGNEKGYFLYGAFEAVGQDDNGNYSASYNTTSHKLSSVGGNTMTPLAYVSRSTARTMASNRGTGWYQISVRQTQAVQLLMSIEFGFNSQLGIGQGIIGETNLKNTGTTIGNITSGTQDNQTTAVNWRGIENFWGNMTACVDGLNINNKVPYICDDFSFVDDTATGYSSVSFSIPADYRTISAFGYDSNFDWVLLPSEDIGANANSAIGDDIYAYSGWRVSQLGGHWNAGTGAGAFFWNCTVSSESQGGTNGARVMYIPS